MPVRFQTAYDTDIWPLTISEVGWSSIDRLDPPLRAPGTAAVLRVRFDCWPGVNFAQLPIASLRFYLDGEMPVVHSLYELLCNNCTSIILRDPHPKFRQRPIELLPGALSPVGFEDSESLGDNILAIPGWLR
jgi:type VI secretion system protein ImpG